MIRKFTVCLMLSAWFLASSCADDEADSPPKSSLSVSANSGLANDTEFTFTITQVNADAVTLYPYGIAKAVYGTVPITEFEDGEATVTFTYSQVGTFEAVVVSNNHTDDGSSVKNSLSNAETITITSNRNDLTAFTLSYKPDDETTINSTKTVIDQVDKEIVVTVPYSVDVTDLIANFTVSPFATVTVGGVAQTSGTTSNDFTTDKTYVVTSQNGAASVNWNVEVVVTDPEDRTGIESFTGTYLAGDVEDRTFPAYVDSAAHIIVFYDTLGTPNEYFSSVSLAYELPGSFQTIQYEGEALEQDTEFDLSGNDQEVTVIAEDPDTDENTYQIYVSDAPTLKLSFEDLNPVVVGKTTDFTILLRALSQPSKEYVTSIDFDTNANLVIGTILADGDPVTDGSTIDYSEPVVFQVEVTNVDLGVTFWVTYTATVGQL
ncbi:MAG TPA: hypothetical protein VGK59_14455 [Ohtaekwangia sp.]